jgi:signal transduction histidine kinase
MSSIQRPARQAAHFRFGRFSPTLRLPTGLRGRLFLAFAGISSFAILAAVAGFIAFVAARQALDEVTTTRVPRTLEALELLRHSESLVATGPALLNAASAEEIGAVTATKNAELTAVRGILNDLQLADTLSPMVREIEVTIDSLATNLDDITTAAAHKDEALSERTALLRNAFSASRSFAAIWSNRFEEAQKQLVDLERGTGTKQADAEKLDALDQAMLAILPLDQLQRKAAEIFQLLVGGAETDKTDELARLKEVSARDMQDMDGLVSGVDLDSSTAVLPKIKLLTDAALGPGGLFAVKEQELKATIEGRRLIAENTRLSGRLSDAVQAFVSVSRRQMQTAASAAITVQTMGAVALALIAALSLISSVLIVWLYIGRSIVSRLSGLSAGMLAIVAGRRDVTVPVIGDDEIAAMGRAVEVFRQNAVERDALLAERAEAAERLEQTVLERTADLRTARDAAVTALAELKAAQANLIHAQKMAALGQLTAGIAHEIKNPLNFVNNFADLSVELLDELKETAEPAVASLGDETRAEIDEIVGMLTGNLAKISEHGRRADGIVKSMLAHSRGGSGDWQSTDINALVEEALNLAYHGARAQDQNFNITLERDFDAVIAPIELVPQDITRVFLNLVGNGFYAADKRRREAGDSFRPVLKVATKGLGDAVEVRVRDNGTGIPPELRERLFQPFFTTKPTGEGTGLGLSISYDIITQQHGGTIAVDSREGEFTEFTIRLPRSRKATMAGRAA